MLKYHVLSDGFWVAREKSSNKLTIIEIGLYLDSWRVHTSGDDVSTQLDYYTLLEKIDLERMAKYSMEEDTA